MRCIFVLCFSGNSVGALMYYLCLLLSCWIVIHTFLICLVVGLKWLFEGD